METNNRLSKQKNTLCGRKGPVLLLFAGILLVLFLFSFTIGRYGVSVGNVIKILLSGIFPMKKTWTSAMEASVLNVRLPRILLSCLVGCCLSAAGASYQGIFRNPMAAPDILGASSGAAFGAALAILWGGTSYQITAAAFAASLVAVGAVFLIARRAPDLPVINLILAGIMVSSLFSAGTSYIKLVADPSNQLPAITYWMMGSLNGSKMHTVLLSLIPMAAGCLTLLLVRWRINLLTLGEEEAHTLGINTNLLRLIVILASTLITAASVSVSGMIGWVGLVIPHLVRKLMGSDYRFLLPGSMLVGAAFLLIVDDVSRNLLATEIPLGILTALIGAPFFIYLMMKQEKNL